MNVFVGLGELLFDQLLGRQYVESQLWYARRRDSRLITPSAYQSDCICGDPACDLPWSDGGKTADGVQ